jgi:hypothetical protein
LLGRDTASGTLVRFATSTYGKIAQVLRFYRCISYIMTI